MSCSDDDAEYASTAPAVANASAPPTMIHGKSRVCGFSATVVLPSPVSGAISEPEPEPEPVSAADPESDPDPDPDPAAGSGVALLVIPAAASTTFQSPPHASTRSLVRSMNDWVGFASRRYRV